MKKLFTLAMVLTLGLDSPATTLKVTSRNFTSEPTQRRRVTLTLITAGPVVVSPWLIAGDSAAQFTDTNGVCYFSNVLAGSFRLDIAGSPGRSFPFSVFDTNAVLDASALINSTNYNTHFYTTTQVDALLAAVVAGAGGTANAVTNLETRAITFTNGLYLGGVGSAPGINFWDSALPGYQNLTVYQGALVGSSLSASFTSFSGNGANLTGLSAANLSGTLASGVSNSAGSSVVFSNQLAAATNAATLTASINSTNGTGTIKAGTFALGANGITSWDGVTNYFTQVGGQTAAQVQGAINSGTNQTVNRWNVKSYGAPGTGSVSLDSAAFKTAISNACKYGGCVFVPNGTYIDTNSYNIPIHSTNGPNYLGSDISFRGDSKAGSIITCAITNSVYLKCQGEIPDISSLTFRGSGSGSNCCIAADPNSTGTYGWMSDALFEGWTGIGTEIGASHGFNMTGVSWRNCYIGCKISGFSDTAYIVGRVDNCSFGLVLGGWAGMSAGGSPIRHGGFYHIGGSFNGYSIVVGGRSYGDIISGYTETATNASIAIGFPSGMLPNEGYSETNIVDELTLAGYGEGVLTTQSNALVKLFVPVNNLTMNNVHGGILVHSTTAWADTSSIKMDGIYYTYAAIKHSDGTLVNGDQNSFGAPSTMEHNWSRRSYTSNGVAVFPLTTNGLSNPAAGQYLTIQPNGSINSSNQVMSTDATNITTGTITNSRLPAFAAGRVKLAAGTATVSAQLAQPTNVIQLTLIQTNGATMSPVYVSAVVPGSSFTILSTDTGATSTNWVAWSIFLPWQRSAVPAYSNPGGTGSRSSLITVSSANLTIGGGAVQNLVDGNMTASGTYSFYFNSSFAVGGTMYLRFDFGAGKSKVITESTLYQSGTYTHGVWKWQGSNDASSWSDIGSSFTLGGASPTVDTAMSANTTGYRYYQLLGVSGNVSGSPWVEEIEFKIDDF